MDPFYTYIVIAALIILIIILVVVGVTLSKLKKTTLYPPNQSTCPDNWDVSANPNYCGLYVKSSTGRENKGSIVLFNNQEIDKSNSKNVGFCSSNSGFGCKNSIPTGDGFAAGTSDYQYVHLNNNPKLVGELYPGVTDRCAKKRWADTLGITWDGVTNFNGC